MTNLSVNLNKIALLRNSRGRNFPNVVDFAGKFCDLGVQGITIHPRQDERHIKVQDAFDLADFLTNKPKIELNIEGYPSEDFIKLIEATKPDQCTLVPDDANQLTSDHGWDLNIYGQELTEILIQIKQFGVRTSIFLDPDTTQIDLAAKLGVDRVELYTELFASSFKTDKQDFVFNQYKAAAAQANLHGIGVNAGHDLDLNNLPWFLKIEGILEVSIGHVLTTECIEYGIKEVVHRYLTICNS